MKVSGMMSLLRQGASVALLGWLISPIAAAGAQDALPKVRLTQMVDAQWGYGNDAWARLDRDAFLVILEFGADGRARIVYPESPRDSPFTEAGNAVQAQLPSADAMFVRVARVHVPTLVAIASDLAPDLSTFTSTGNTWDFDYDIPRGISRNQMVRALAAIMFGGEGMPYSFELRDIAPQLSNFAVGALNSCGYLFASEISPSFNNFLWQTFGPQPVGFFGGGGFSPWLATAGGGVRFGLFPLGFRRYVDAGLWGRFGAGCEPLARQRYFYAIGERGPGEIPPDNGDEVALAPLPKDRDPLGRPPVVPDVGIEVASPAEQARRGALVKDAAGNLVAQKPTAPVRSEAEQLVQRSQVLDFVRRLSVQQSLGFDGNRVAAQNAGRRPVQRRGAGSSGRVGGVQRTSAGGSGAGVGSSGGSSGSGSSGGSAGSGSSSGGDRGGSAGGGRAGGGGRSGPPM